jgi:lysozyme
MLRKVWILLPIIAFLLSPFSALAGEHRNKDVKASRGGSVATTTTYYREGVIEIAHHEGIVTTTYKDVNGTLTWGVGHTKSAGGLDPKTRIGKTATISEVVTVLKGDLDRKYVKMVNSAFKGQKLTQTQYDAVLSYAFNLGKSATQKLASAYKKGGAAAVQKLMLSDTSHGTRRMDEWMLFSTGVYSSGGVAHTYTVNPDLTVNWASETEMDITGLF